MWLGDVHISQITKVQMVGICKTYLLDTTALFHEVPQKLPVESVALEPHLQAAPAGYSLDLSVLLVVILLQPTHC